MSKLMLKLWQDDAGALIAAEYLFIATILVIGIIVGLANVRDAVVNELTELANAYMALSQGYAFSGTVGCAAQTDGSEATDAPETFDPDHSGPVTSSDINAIPCD
ncbi:MAG: Flp family type IVb pilin [Gemmataceae bacterium]